MYSSISYVEISCKYNHTSLVLFTGSLPDVDSRAFFSYRNRQYAIAYVRNERSFYLTNKKGVVVAKICDGVFKFYVSCAREIGLELVWGLLAVLNIYPVNE